MLMEVFMQGGPVMYPLLLCSVITVAVIIERCLFWLRLHRSRIPTPVSDLCRQLVLERKNLTTKKYGDIVARVLRAGLASPTPEASLKMRQAAAQAVEEMLRYLGVLSTMVSLAPLLGIFGTVLGIIESFQLLGDASLVDPIAATGGLAQALVTTAFGLGIAMPSLVAYKIFQAKAVRLQQEIVTGCTELEMSLGLAAAQPA